MKEYTLDLKAIYDSKMSNIEESLSSLKRNFNLDKFPYSYEHKIVDGDVKKYSPISYDSIEVGHILVWIYYNKSWDPIYKKIKVTNKFNGIVFFKCLSDNKNYFTDCGAWEYNDKKSKKMYLDCDFYPAKVIVPSYVNIEDANFPDICNIVNIL